MKDNLDSLVDYINVLKTLKDASTIRAGNFYCYKYFFHQHYPIQELKFYDWFPLIFCFGVRNPKANFEKGTGQYFYGLNFHHMPVAARRWWLNKVQNIAKVYFEKGGYRRIPAINYDTFLNVMKKSKIAVRQYRFEAVHDLKQVSLDEIDYLMEFYSKTYYQATIKEIQLRYQNFKP